MSLIKQLILWIQSFTHLSRMREKLRKYILEDELNPQATIQRRRLYYRMDMELRIRLVKEWNVPFEKLPYSYLHEMHIEQERLTKERNLFKTQVATSPHLSTAQKEATFIMEQSMGGVVLETMERDRKRREDLRTKEERHRRDANRGQRVDDNDLLLNLQMQNAFHSTSADPTPTPPSKPDHGGGGGSFGGGGAGGSWESTPSSHSHSSHSSSDNSNNDSGGSYGSSD